MTPDAHHSLDKPHTADVQSTALARLSDRDRDAALNGVPYAERQRILEWKDAFEKVNTARGFLTRDLEKVARKFGLHPSRVRAKWDEWIRSGRDWSVFADGRALRGALATRTGNLAFQSFFRKCCEQNQRKIAPAIRVLCQLWRAREVIPGYEDFPGWPAIPEGWSESNLRRFVPTRAELKSKQQGMKAAATLFSQTLTTRVGMWPGALIQFDDVWHDHYVRHQNQVLRVLEFGALDVFSACRFAWGSKPRLGRKLAIDGKKNDGLTEREFRLFAAGVLYHHGVNLDQGTRLVGEGGTAKFPDAWRAILADTFGRFHDGRPIVEIAENGVTGEQQAVLGLWTGRAGGNPRKKAALESIHNLIHNDLGLLIGQTGKDRQHAQEEAHGLIKEQMLLIKWARELPPHLQAELRHPLLDYWTQFVPLRDLLYTGVINGREDHSIEGWHKIPGRIVTEYTAMPGSDLWMGLDALPAESRAIILAAAASAPAQWSRTRALSPGECYEQGRQHLRPIPMWLLCQLLGPDLAVERKVDGLFFRFRDVDVDPREDLVYSSRIRTPEGHWRELPDREKFLVFANPYHPEALLVCDARLRCLGVADRVNRVCAIDHDGLKRAWGAAHARQTARLERIRADWEPDADAATADRARNREIVDRWRAAESLESAGAGAGDLETGRLGDRETRDAELVVDADADALRGLFSHRDDEGDE